MKSVRNNYLFLTRSFYFKVPPIFVHPFQYKFDIDVMADMCVFTRNGVFNFRNSHVQLYENPYAIRETVCQRQFNCNVCACIN